MSGLAGIYNLNGRPADPILLRRMIRRAAHRGPDASDCWINGPVGMGHVMLQTTPESLYERQPWLDESGTICLTLDGRVDNREELILSLEAADFHLRTDTDAELLLRAYQRWGEHCPEHVVGDFALVVWDGPRRQLFCARDILGLKPFYYCLHGSSFYWASEIPPLFEDEAVARRPNEAMIAEFLSGMVVTNTETVYEGISRLQPAHTLVVRTDRVETRRYWTIDPHRRIEYSNDEDYAQHFYELFSEAIRCRLRSHRPIGLELSGGLDSSSVVSVLQSSSSAHPQDRDRFQTYSLIFPGMPCDERPFIDAVAAQGSFPSNCIPPKPPTLTGFLDDVHRYLDLPDHPNGAMNDSLRALASQQGCRVLLTGSGGDEWLTGSFFYYADLLRTLKLGTLLRRLHADRPLYCDRSSHDLFSVPLVQFGLLPLIPQSCRNLGKWILRRTPIPDWIAPELWYRTHMTERLRQASYSLPFSSYAQQDLFSSTIHGLGIHGIELDERAASSFSLEKRHPFNDRRIIEFALALPEEQRWRDNPKFILRKAIGKFLPPSVHERVLKADFSCIFAQALLAESMDAAFRSLAVASMGWVDGDRILTAYEAMETCYRRGDVAYRFHIAPLWMVFGVELWFRTVFPEHHAQPPLPTPQAVTLSYSI
jgi:asparagine synthase (glutamine-hydrolysing)